MLIENIFVQIPLCLFWKDTTSTYLGCNQALASSAGMVLPQEIIGKTDYDLCWEEFAPIYQQGDQETLANCTHFQKKESLLKPDGTLIKILTTKQLLFDNNGQKIGVIGSYTELVDEKFYGKPEPTKTNVPLSKMQANCLLHLARGKTAKQIANKLMLSSRTVEHYINIIKVKLRCYNKASLVEKALTLDFIRARLFEE